MTKTRENNPLRTLRIKFMAVVMGMTALVLAVAFAVICWLNYNQSVEEVYAELNTTIVSSNTYRTYQHADAPFSALTPHGGSTLFERKPMGEFLDAMMDDLFFDSQDQSTQPSIGPSRDAASFPIALYLVKEDVWSNIISREATAVVDDDALSTALKAIAASDRTSGLLPNERLFYTKANVSNVTFVAFADESAASNWQDLAKTLALVGLAVLVVFFVLAWLLSRWALRPVKEAWDQQQQFIADASHEMKTPLTVILANAAIALKKPQATIAEQSQWIEGIQSEAQNMEQLVLDMLVLAQPKSAASSNAAEAQIVNLSDLAERAALQFEAVAFERGILVESQVEPKVTLQGSTVSLQRMIGTLVDNAIKYAAEGTTIDISLKRVGANAQLTVHNWGEAIPAEDLPHLFDRFYRADKARDRSSEEGQHSFGLGLAIARKIAQEHGGTLSATSSTAEGTTFTFTVPAQ